MSREDIQNRIYEWATNQRFTAPYGILTSKVTSVGGRTYRSITFGYARTRDIEVQIYGPRFIRLRDSAASDEPIFTSESTLMDHLATLI